MKLSIKNILILALLVSTSLYSAAASAGPVRTVGGKTGNDSDLTGALIGGTAMAAAGCAFGALSVKQVHGSGGADLALACGAGAVAGVAVGGLMGSARADELPAETELQDQGE